MHSASVYPLGTRRGPRRVLKLLHLCVTLMRRPHTIMARKIPQSMVSPPIFGIPHPEYMVSGSPFNTIVA